MLISALRKAAVVFTLVGSMALSTSKTDASICLPSEPKPDSPYYYLLALVDALSYAKSGRERLADISSTSSDHISSIFDSMLAIKLADRDYQCAAAILAPYQASRDKAIETSANLATKVFTALVELDKKFLEHFKKLLNLAEGDQDLGNYLEQAAELGAKADDIWKVLPVAVAASTYSIVEADPGTGKLAHLTLTGAQRAEILKKLSDTFGASIQKGMQAGQLTLEFSAGALYQFVGDKKWKSKDSYGAGMREGEEK